MASPALVKPVLSPQMKFLMQCASNPNASPSGAKAKSSVIEQIRVLVNIISEDPSTDYGGDKKVLNKEAVAHSSKLTAAVIALADMMWSLAQEDEESLAALSASGFTGYFARYYCDSMRLSYKKLDTINFADQCNSNVIGPNLYAMLGKVKHK